MFNVNKIHHRKGKQTMEKDAVKTIEDIIKNRTWHINQWLKSNDDEDKKELFMKELNGMLVCLKNIAPEDVFYCINDWNTRIEFGYYGVNGEWHSLEGGEN